MHRRAGLAKFWVIAPAVASVLASATPATAGGFYAPYQSGLAIGSAVAGCSARSDDAGFFFCNPATITGLDGATATIEARGYVPSIRIDAKNATSPLGADLTSAGSSGEMTTPLGAPGGFAALPITRNLWLGIGVSGHFAVDIEADPGWAGRFQLLKSDMRGINLSSALAWRVANWLTIAAGVQAQRFSVALEKSELIPTMFGPVEARGYLRGSDWALGGVAGVLLTPLPGTRIGIGYKSPLTHDVRGTAGAELPGLPADGARFDVALPEIVSAGIEQRVTPTVRLFGEVQWVNWSRFKGFDISFASGRPNELRPQVWEDTWMGAIGLGWTVLPGTEITAGVHYDTPVTKGGTNTLSPDGARTMIAAGINQRVGERGMVSVYYGHVLFEDAPVNAASLTSGTLTGTFKGSLDLFGASLKLTW